MRRGEGCVFCWGQCELVLLVVLFVTSTCLLSDGSRVEKRKKIEEFLIKGRKNSNLSILIT
jgi:hypothetical protein